LAVPNRTGRSRLTLVLLLVTSVTLLTLDFRGFGPIQSAQDTMRDAFQPVQDGVSKVFGPVTTSWSALTEYDELEDENAQLRAELEALRADSITNSNAEQELAAILTELEIEYLAAIPRITARTVGQIGNFSDLTVEIDKGSNDGIAKQMPAVTSGGLIGQVIEVGANRSRIGLITDPSFNVGVRLVGLDDIAIGSGSGEGEPLLVEAGVDPETVVEVGTSAVTSGIHGSLYPPDIPVGLVSDVSVDETTLNQVLQITPTADMENITFVTVLLYHPPE
jgi:rod shape-determining protein MreC